MQLMLEGEFCKN